MAVAAPSRVYDCGIVKEQQPLLDRRILFHPAKDTTLCSRIASLPPGIEPLNQGFEVTTSSNGAPDAQGTKRSWQEANGRPQAVPVRPQEDEIPLDLGAPLRIGAGLSNLGNTCFLNSVLQCLTYTPPLANFLRSGQHKASCRNSGFCAMCALEGHVKNALQSWGKVIAPNYLVKNLRSISRAFQPWRQEDAHEYLRYLMEALQKACLPSKTPSNSPEQEKSLLYKIFGGRLRSQVKCTSCLQLSETVDPFLDLSLDITRADSLGKALARFTANDILDGDNKYNCEKCKKRVRAIKRFTIDSAPNILTVQFKRFSSIGLHGQKIDKKVHFERVLDITPFMSNARDGALYDLYGVLVHAGGSTRSGHYYCFVRTSSDMWHILDDTRVKQLSEQNVLDQKAYILFYIRKSKPRDQQTPRSFVLAAKPVEERTVSKLPAERTIDASDQCHLANAGTAPIAEEQKKNTNIFLSANGPAAPEICCKSATASSPPTKMVVLAETVLPAEIATPAETFSFPAQSCTEKCSSAPPKSVSCSAATPTPPAVSKTDSAAELEETSTPDLSKSNKSTREQPNDQSSPPRKLKQKNLDSRSQGSLRKIDKCYLKLLRAMPKSRRFLMARALELEQGEKTEVGVVSKRGRLTENGESKQRKTSPESSAAPVEHKAEAGVSAIGTSEASVPINELFGSGVARWDGVDGKEIDKFLKEEHEIPTTRRLDEWDEAYDRGKVKKLRRGAGGGRLTPLKSSDGSSQNANPFQELAANKQK